jgi:hypothetical protein
VQDYSKREHRRAGWRDLSFVFHSFSDSLGVEDYRFPPLFRKWTVRNRPQYKPFSQFYKFQNSRKAVLSPANGA